MLWLFCFKILNINFWNNLHKKKAISISYFTIKTNQMKLQLKQNAYYPKENVLIVE